MMWGKPVRISSGVTQVPTRRNFTHSNPPTRTPTAPPPPPLAATPTEFPALGVRKAPGIPPRTPIERVAQAIRAALAKAEGGQDHPDRPVLKHLKLDPPSRPGQTIWGFARVASLEQAQLLCEHAPWLSGVQLEMDLSNRQRRIPSRPLPAAPPEDRVERERDPSGSGVREARAWHARTLELGTVLQEEPLLKVAVGWASGFTSYVDVFLEPATQVVCLSFQQGALERVMKIRWAQIQRLRIVRDATPAGGLRTVTLILTLKCPALLYACSHDAYSASYVSVAEAVADRFNSIRTTDDFTTDAAVGSHLTYMLRFERPSPHAVLGPAVSGSATEAEMESLCEAFARIGSSYGWIGRPRNSTDVSFTAESVARQIALQPADVHRVEQLASDEVQWEALETEARIPWKVLYLVQCLLSQGILLAQALDLPFWRITYECQGQLDPDAPTPGHRPCGYELFSEALTQLFWNGRPLPRPMQACQEAIGHLLDLQLPPDAEVWRKESEEQCWVPNVMVTPTRMWCYPPEAERSNRIVRRYPFPDHFLRVSFIDDDFRSLTNLGIECEPLYDYCTKVLRAGVSICGRRFAPLVYSSNQLREMAWWMFAPDGQITADTIRQELGDFSMVGSVPKYGARLGLAVTSTLNTITLTPLDFTVIKDLKRDGRCFTDGVGAVSAEMAERIWKQYQRGQYAIQHRQHVDNLLEAVADLQARFVRSLLGGPAPERSPPFAVFGPTRPTFVYPPRSEPTLAEFQMGPVPSAFQVRHPTAALQLQSALPFRRPPETYSPWGRQGDAHRLVGSPPRDAELRSGRPASTTRARPPPRHHPGFRTLLALPPPSPPLYEVSLFLRESQVKFASKYAVLEVCSVSMLMPAYLNRQIILILSNLGVPNAVFLDLQEEMLARCNRLFTDARTARQLINRECRDSAGLRSLFLLMLDRGLLPGNDPFFFNAMLSLRNHMLAQVQKRARIYVPEVRAQVLMHLQEPFNVSAKGDASNPKTRVVVGPVVLARNPCVCPHHIVVAQARDYPQLHHLINVVVFSTKGARPMPDILSGGDLDGDDYFISWDPKLIPPRTYPPTDTPADSPADTLKCPTPTCYAFDDVVDFFVKFARMNNLGVLSNTYLAMADQSPQGIFDQRCVDLAGLINKAVDAAKTGHFQQLPHKLRVDKYPDFMEKGVDVPQYESVTVLGLLYRAACKRPPPCGVPFELNDQSGAWHTEGSPLVRLAPGYEVAPPRRRSLRSLTSGKPKPHSSHIHGTERDRESRSAGAQAKATQRIPGLSRSGPTVFHRRAPFRPAPPSLAQEYLPQAIEIRDAFNFELEGRHSLMFALPLFVHGVCSNPGKRTIPSPGLLGRDPGLLRQFGLLEPLYSRATPRPGAALGGAASSIFPPLSQAIAATLTHQRAVPSRPPAVASVDTAASIATATTTATPAPVVPALEADRLATTSLTEEQYIRKKLRDAEAQLVTGALAKLDKRLKRRRFVGTELRVGEAVRSLRERYVLLFKNLCAQAEASISPVEMARLLASAWYASAYYHANPEQPFLTFGWIVGEILLADENWGDQSHVQE
ncbi:putative RNA-dependent RNA polymerase 1 [Paratrimastix pyriformis]|uniref:RNA-directed RNA polymerase n=1 Tax=Paratrimastix pyriformis TaxID=342808 RepID=A0ABQ8UBP0_9EUKA|nr:putative RNA-dependent RNA polymerase 1 [Paratrimastix pyriformis]